MKFNIYLLCSLFVATTCFTPLLAKKSKKQETRKEPQQHKKYNEDLDIDDDATALDKTDIALLASTVVATLGIAGVLVGKYYYKINSIQEAHDLLFGKSVEQIKTTPVEQIKTTPVEQIKTTPVEQIKTTPVEQIKTTPVEQIKTTPVEQIKTTPVEQIKTTPVEQIKTTPDEKQKLENPPPAIIIEKQPSNNTKSDDSLNSTDVLTGLVLGSVVSVLGYYYLTS